MATRSPLACSRCPASVTRAATQIPRLSGCQRRARADVELQFGPRVGLLEDPTHRRGVEPKLGEREQPVRVDPRVWSANRLLGALPHPSTEIAEPHASADRHGGPGRSTARLE